ncbi:MAG: hypothetical protein JWM07_818 [Candidatus Saccharibacteria bacterium]|nr:hypothetical protein [Candidatus Saccharibacteria bacterium]
MSPNEQFPQQPDNLGTKGQHAGDLEGDLHEEGVVNFNTPLDKAVAENKIILDRDSIRPLEGEPLPFTEADQEQARRMVEQKRAAEAKPENRAKKIGKRMLMGFGAGMAVVGIGAGALLLGVNKDESDGKTENLPPFPETNNTAPPVPGGQPIPGETQPVPVIEVKFTGENGAEVTKDELSQSVKLTTDKYPTGIDAMRGYVATMEDMMNYLPTETQVRENLGLADDVKLTKDHYLAVASMFHDAHDSVYKSTNGPLYKGMRELALSTAGYHYDTKDEPTPYQIELDISENLLIISAKDNSVDNTVKDDLKSYRFMADGGSGMERSIGTNGNQPDWKIPGNANFKLVN